MSRREWAAIAAGVVSVITAIIGSLAGLGEHAPGMVGGLVFMLVALVLIIIQERQLEDIRKGAYKRETDYVDSLVKTALSLQTVSSTLGNLCERVQRMEDQVDSLESASSTAAAIVTATTAAAAAAREAAQELRAAKAERAARKER